MKRLVVGLVWIGGVAGGCFPLGLAAAQTNVLVAFTTTNPTPLNIGYAGFTTELLGTGIEYGDTNMQQVAEQLSPGWLLFPAGTTGDAFNWSTERSAQAPAGASNLSSHRPVAFAALPTWAV